MAVKALKNWLAPIINPLACVPTPQPTPYTSAEELLRKLERQLKEFSRQGLAGDKRTLLHGQGLDFADLRQYFPGDDIRKIDWNVFARTGEPHVKEYQDEKRLTIWLYVDLSPSMFFGTRKTKATLALEISGLLGLLAQAGGHALGVVIHSESGSSIMSPKTGYAHLQQVSKTLFSTYQQQQWTCTQKAKNAPRLQQGFHEFSQMLRGHSLVFILSDFMDTGTSWEHDWGKLARKSSLYNTIIFDPNELRLSEELGIITLFDPETKHAITVDCQHQKFKRHYQQTAQHYQKTLQQTLNQFSKSHTLSTEMDPINNLLQLLQAKGGHH